MLLDAIFVRHSHSCTIDFVAVVLRMLPPVVQLAIGHGNEDLGAVFSTQLLGCCSGACAVVRNVSGNGFDGINGSDRRRAGFNRLTAFAAGTALERAKQVAQTAELVNALHQVIARLVAEHGGLAIAAGARHMRVSQQLASGFESGDVGGDFFLVHAINMAAF